MSDIRWGKYRQYEGPYFPGTQPYVTPEDPSFGEKVLSVFTATEGGRYDAINMYDRCVLSVGLIQFCEAGIWAVSDMLGKACEEGAPALQDDQEFSQWVHEAGYVFTNSVRKKWRFYRRGAEGFSEVDTVPEQRRLFLLNSNGKIGSWDDGSKDYAMRWAEVIAGVYEDPVAQAAQLDFIMGRIYSFMMPISKELWDSDEPSVWEEASLAAYLSFAGNLPAVANKQLITHLKHTKEPVFTEGWTVELLKQLTFGPNIAIYPHRYSKIRPVLEELFGVDLPDYAKELKSWESQELLASVEDIQSYLVYLGFDLGEYGPDRNGVDGSWGTKSKEALISYKIARGIFPVDGSLTDEIVECLKKDAEDMVNYCPEVPFNESVA
jgi:hypothetical protein